MFIFLSGNLSDGFVAIGPYETWDDAVNVHGKAEDRMMELISPRKDKCSPYTSLREKEVKEINFSNDCFLYGV